MKKIGLLACAVIIMAIIFFENCNAEEKNIQSITSSRIELSVQPGEHWLEKVKMLIFSRDRIPQMAAWIEDDNNNYLLTIIVTNKNAKNKWLKAPKEGRPEALPVWNNKIVNSFMQIDSVSSATPKGTVFVNINNDLLINGNEYNVYLEINHSFDYNDFWTKDNSGVNGQPSIVYFAKFIKGVPGEIELKPIGHGSVDGINGNITNELHEITTALEIIKTAYIINQ